MIDHQIEVTEAQQADVSGVLDMLLDVGIILDEYRSNPKEGLAAIFDDLPLGLKRKPYGWEQLL